MSKIRVGIIGVGRISDLHYLGYKANPKAELYAISDVNEGLLQRRVHEWGVKNAYPDYRRLLEDSKVDAVEVITPHHVHAKIGIAALEAGKHVSLQKPMAMNLTEADALIDAAKRSGKLFRVIENYRFYPPYNKAKEIIESGEIGEPLSIRIKSFSGNDRYGWDVPQGAQEWRSDPSRSGDGTIIFDHGQHIWSIAKYFMGDVEKVFAFIGRTEVKSHHEMRPGSLLDSPSLITWKYAGVHKYGSWEAVHSEDLMVRSKYYPMDVWLEITGSRGILWVNRCIAGLLNKPPVEVYRDGVTTSFSDVDSDYATGFVRGVQDFVDSIIEGHEAQLTGAEARDVLRFSLAILVAGREHREVDLEEVIN